MNHKGIRNSAFIKVAAAFLLLIIVPFGFGITIISVIQENQILSRWQAESEAGIVAIQDDITSIHLVLNSVLIHIRHDEALSPQRINRNSYHMMQAMAQLRRYQVSSSYIHLLAYVDVPQGLIISNVSSSEPANFAQRFFNTDESGSDYFWHSVANSSNTVFSEPLMVIPSAVTDGNVLVYTVKLRETKIFDSPIILALMDGYAIESHLAGILPMESAGLLITDRDDRILISAGNLPYGIPSSSVSFSLNDDDNHINQQDYMITHFVAANSWNYYMFLPNADLLQDVRGATRLYSFFGIAFVAASILFFFLYFKYSVLPLRRFIRLMRRDKTGELLPPPKDYEYSEIYAGYQALAMEKDTIQRQLDDSYLIRLNYLLYQLVIGGASEEEYIEQSDTLALKLENKRYYTVVLLFSADGKAMSVDMDLHNFVRQYLAKNNLGYFVPNVLDDALTVLLALTFPEQEAHKLEAVRLQAHLSSEYNTQTMACVGGNYSKLCDIRLSFQEAVRTSRYRNITNKNNCITFSETGEDSAFSRSYPTKIVQSFYHALSNESPEAILARIREISRLMEGYTITLFRCIYCDLAFGVFHYLQRQSPIPPLSTELLDDITRALETEEMHEMKKLMGNLENNFTELSDKETNIKLVDKARKYIDGHFNDPGLSIQEISEALGVSTGHLSRNYKKDTGETLLNYINTRRIEKAKKLLIETDMPLQQVVHEIGYLDVSSFHRKFKSIVGLAPGAFRVRAHSSDTQDI